MLINQKGTDLFYWGIKSDTTFIATKQCTRSTGDFHVRQLQRAIMPFKIIFDEQTSSITIEAIGVVNNEEALNTLQEVFNDKRFPTIKYLISDRTKCTKYDLDPETTRKAAELSKQALNLNKQFIWAAVAPKDLEFTSLECLKYFSMENKEQK